MKKIDRMREKVSILPTSVYLSKMHDAGWSLVALEWEREVETSATPEEQEAPSASEEIPFGLRIASDCRHLEDDPLEMQTLKFLAEMIVQDVSFTSMADALNVREYRTRDGRPWTAAGVFKLTPRLIDVAPALSGNPARNSCPASPGTLNHSRSRPAARHAGSQDTMAAIGEDRSGHGEESCEVDRLSAYQHCGR